MWVTIMKKNSTVKIKSGNDAVFKPGISRLDFLNLLIGHLPSVPCHTTHKCVAGKVHARDHAPLPTTFGSFARKFSRLFAPANAEKQPPRRSASGNKIGRAS